MCNWWICFYLQYRFTITTSTNIYNTTSIFPKTCKVLFLLHIVQNFLYFELKIQLKTILNYSASAWPRVGSSNLLNISGTDSQFPTVSYSNSNNIFLQNECKIHFSFSSGTAPNISNNVKICFADDKVGDQEPT